jgi:predicted helicase
MHKGQQGNLFGAVSEENIARIKRQNKRKISVIIGNPPYNANQLNENENNKNRQYPEIDKRIKDTYIKASTAQKTKQYDMFVRFFRWASDRIEENGIIAFITNRSFIDKRNFDGFRKIIGENFSDLRIIDLGGDWKESGVAAGGNVFGIGTGVAITLFVRRADKSRKHRNILYAYSPATAADEKLSWLQSTNLEAVSFVEIAPDKHNYWLGEQSKDYDGFIPLVSKAAKQTKQSSQEMAIFKLFTLGVVTARDEWVYDESVAHLNDKLRFFVETYNKDKDALGRKKLNPQTAAQLSPQIKWSRAVKRDLENGIGYALNRNEIVDATYRPFVHKKLYYDGKLNEMRYQLPSVYGEAGQLRKIPTIVFTDAASQKPFVVLATNTIFD